MQQPAIRHRTTTLLAATLLVVAGLARLDAGSGADRPRFTWAMAERYGLDRDGDGIVDPHDTPADVHPAVWAVEFDACSWRGDLVRFDVEVDGVATASSAECRFTLDFSVLGAHRVTVRAVTPGGEVVESRQLVVLRDLLIVGLGDSYASGEGAPDLSLAGSDLADALAAYEIVRDGIDHAENIARDLEDLERAYDAIVADVARARAVFDAAARDVASRLAALDQATDRLRDVEADARPVQDAAAAWRRDCVDDFHLLRCPVRTAELIAALAAFGIAAGAELITDGYNAVVAAIDAGIAAARGAVTSARAAYDAAVAARDDASDALDAVVRAANDTAAALEAAAAAFARAQLAVDDATRILERLRSGATASWQDESCHRSARSAQALAAAALERADPHSSVTFVHVACSGATTAGVVAQVAEVLDRVGDREVDAVLLAVGGNDAGFGKIVRALIARRDPSGIDLDAESLAGLARLCDQVPTLAGTCAQLVEGLPDESAETVLGEGLAGIADGYRAVADALAGLVDASRVFIAEYGDASHGDDLQVCNATAAPGISTAEWTWVDDVVTPSINAAVAEAARTHGWNLISGIEALFGPHGYCADDRWMLRFEESAVVQGDISGTAHPNARGYARTAAAITETVGAFLDEGTARLFVRGDTDGDTVLAVTDVIVVLDYQFRGADELGCFDAADFNDDGRVDISDAIASLGFQFLGQQPPPAPGSTNCGADPTADDLGCESFAACEI